MTGTVRKLAASAVALGVFGAAAALGTFAAFSGTTTNAGNTFAAGSVAIGDNDAGSALLSLVNASPGAVSTNCISVTTTGSLSSSVRLYAAVTGTLAPYLTLTVTRGTDPSPSFGSCTTFVPDATNYVGAGAGVVYSGLLSAFPASYAAGLVDPTPGSPETWTASERHSYRFTVSLNSDDAAQGLSGSASFTWEARNL